MNPREFLSFVVSEPEYQALHRGQDAPVADLRSLTLLLAASYLEKPRPLAVVLPTLYDAQVLMDNLNDFVPQDRTVFFPYDEVLRVESLGTSHEMREERINALTAAIAGRPVIFVTHAVACLRLLRSRAVFSNRIFTLRSRERIARKELIDRMEAAGYVRVNRVTHCFEYALRGEIFDLWSANSLAPTRIEFFDEDIEEIRSFDPATELSTGTVGEVIVVPAGEFVFSPAEKEAGITAVLSELEKTKYQSGLARQELEDRVRLTVEKIGLEGMGETESRYLPYFDRKTVTVGDFLTGFDIWHYHPSDLLATAESYKSEETTFFKELVKSGQSLAGERLYADPESSLENMPHLSLLSGESRFGTTEIPYRNANLSTSTNLLSALQLEGYQIFVCLERERLASFVEHLVGDKIAYTLYPEQSDLTVIDGHLNSGFAVPKRHLAFLSANGIFGLERQSGRFLTRFKEAKIIRKYEELEPGDYVVHEDYGIGRFLGVTELNGLDYLKVEYAGEGNFLYVPLSKFKLIRKYAGKEGTVPTLDTFGGTSWTRRKARIRARVSYLADKLLALYAERLAKPGLTFPSEPEFESGFARAFPYRLTKSQEQAWTDISRDMESPHPMDRLLAGDVGFGKTELAFRACYKAILSGRQAAILCPTTILAKQHAEVAVRRFQGFGVEIAVLSRFTRPRDLQRQLKRIREGKVHLIIGTHKLLGNEVTFASLGLLVIDEEQRFGVTHKERIKELSANIDVLTLTATPIPRTLQMSLLGVKSLSQLLEAPQNRMPIKTYVCRYDRGLVKEVISRELGRGGQVYYLHNRIDSIYSKARSLQELFPSARLAVVHGSLSSDEIGDTMNDFYDGKTDILVCTTIIETGLDIPNVNTIIIENADHFGLAQLYQIKGRVGRSNRLAYAYLFYEEYRHLSEQGRKRLKAIKEFTELGSGYRIASQDLNIRGAGDILGKEQAGFIDSIGYDSYVRLLKEVMEEKKVADRGAAQAETRPLYELTFSLDSHIPSSYADDADRIAMYQELSDIDSREALVSYEKRLRDVYGPLPEEVKNLFIKREIEIWLNRPFVESFTENIDHYVLVLSAAFTAQEGIVGLLQNALKELSDTFSIRYAHRKFVIYLRRRATYLLDLYSLVSTLGQLDKTE